MSDRARLISLPTVLLTALLAASFSVETATAQQPTTQPAAVQTTAPRTPAQLEQLVAPIALYPDDLLAQMLMASTYPLEVIEAARWSKANPNVTGAALETAMQKQDWDASVKALTAVPQTLELMNDKLDWMQDLGEAFLAQQSDVMDAVQRLRARADQNGQLQTGPKQKVTKSASLAAPSGAAPQPIYIIEPATPGEYYGPIYGPTTIYGAWPYPAYAPFSW